MFIYISFSEQLDVPSDICVSKPNNMAENFTLTDFKAQLLNTNNINLKN